jgi:hypothetical protein
MPDYCTKGNSTTECHGHPVLQHVLQFFVDFCMVNSALILFLILALLQSNSKWVASYLELLD